MNGKDKPMAGNIAYKQDHGKQENKTGREIVDNVLAARDFLGKP
jgi:hypothetical protein